ncbi:hypothetical protein OUY22_10090, partial [Nonomuraea sp. MCN248]|nr:hypothetical protein [Nonomuraea corallina]
MIDHNASDSASPPALTPSDLLGFDPYDDAFLRDPYSSYRKLRRPFHRTRGGLVIATSHELCSAILRDPRFGHGPTPPSGPDEPVRSFLMMDPPDHTRMRGLVSRAFTPGMVRRLRPRIETITAELVAALPDEADLVRDFAYPLPVMVISEMLGVPPEDHERFRGWSETVARSLDPIVTDELAERNQRDRREFHAYFRELIALRRR